MDEARRIAIQAENFYIENEQLYHITVMRGKRLNLIRPAFTQLCISKCYRMEVFVTVCHSHAATGKRRTRSDMSQVYRTLRALRTTSD
jgi:hypothetical protein